MDDWCSRRKSNCVVCLTTDPKLRWCPNGAIQIPTTTATPEEVAAFLLGPLRPTARLFEAPSTGIDIRYVSFANTERDRYMTGQLNALLPAGVHAEAVRPINGSLSPPLHMLPPDVTPAGPGSRVDMGALRYVCTALELRSDVELMVKTYVIRTT